MNYYQLKEKAELAYEAFIRKELGVPTNVAIRLRGDAVDFQEEAGDMFSVVMCDTAEITIDAGTWI